MDKANAVTTSKIKIEILNEMTEAVVILTTAFTRCLEEQVFN
jgi:hypothetical protein